ncbi:MAG: hypothetical protein J5622_04360 [Firmicutes bacterium]|nr:hypothetical protein [Bacillota bacterium]MBR6014551.1 hypothetical protein [Bacillota bacterium]
MSVSGVSTINTASINLKAEIKTKTEVSTEKNTVPASAEGAAKAVDSFEKSEPAQEIGYGNIAKGLSADQVQELNDQRLNSLKSMVEKLISQQAGKATGINFSELKIDISIDITSISAENVESDIFNDPNWGVDAMATKLMDMALSLSGGDSSKAELLMNAVEKGFSMAGEAWGDDLPDVCKATLNEVRNRFDYWSQNGSMDGYEYKGYEI